MTAVCETLVLARSNIAERVKQRPSKTRGRPPLADQELMDSFSASANARATLSRSNSAPSPRSSRAES